MVVLGETSAYRMDTESIPGNQLLISSATDARWAGLPFDHVRCPPLCRKDGPEYENYALSLILRGKCETEISYSSNTKRLFHFMPGSFCAYPPGRHWDKLEAAGSTIELINITVSNDWLHTNGLLLVRRPEIGIVIPCAHDRTVQALGFGMLRELKLGCPSGVLYAEGICLALLGRLDSLAGPKATSRPGATRKLSGPILRRVIDFIESNLDHKLNIAAIARVAGMGERNFCVCFRNTFDLPVHRYVSNRRLDRAAAQLRETRKSFSEIARACGYSSQSHFISAFREATGQTPAKYRGNFFAAD
jgi:AraC family transcriptional regulator